ncbi:hypothetical protein GE061_012071 [Apolygus lucorum]|uniref:Uncharacterized protein n=1 Tax=Apolygus lucorum TaxID=248454 RepID=A0A6A4JW46_APOLU|nr:hypothetical protein GE061_012071 [Apolygus lucorum]
MVDDGYSDDGLYSEDEKPPAAYLHKRRNAFCITSPSADKDTSLGSAPVLNFLKKRGITPHVKKSQNEDSELEISSDEDDFRKVSEQLKKDVSLQVTLPFPVKSLKTEQYPEVDRRMMMRRNKVEVPAFLKTPRNVNIMRTRPPQAPVPSLKSTATAIGKTSLLPGSYPNFMIPK